MSLDFDPALDFRLLLAVLAIPLAGYVVQIFLRRRLPREFDGRENLTAVSTPKDADPKDGQCKDPVEKYDPDKHLLFPDILFSPGFE